MHESEKEKVIVLVLDDHRRTELKKAINAMGFSRPSRIQEAALPILLSDP
jgi:superfamily II DNA/RNA helicase